MLTHEPIYKPSSIFCFKPILLSAHKLILLIYGNNSIMDQLPKFPFPHLQSYEQGITK